MHISRKKGNKTIKFDQFIDYNNSNIFLQNLHWKWGIETSPRPLSVFEKALWGKNKWSAA